MKNKKITILLEGLHKVLEEIQNIQNAPHQQSTVKVTYESGQGPTTITALEIKKLQAIFPSVKLENVIKDFDHYLTLPSQILGKRSSKIVLSHSSQYMLKVIEEDDINQTNKMMHSLLDRFQHSKTNCLVNIYFIFFVEYTLSNVKLTDRYIIMPNIRGNFDKCLKTFDIKGHLEARVIGGDDFVDFKFGKDENFVHSDELESLKKFTEVKLRSKMIDQIEQNIGFLTKYGILDYSLLFSFERSSEETELQNSKQGPCQQIRISKERVLKWMLIDYFQIYNQKKKLENKFKSIFRKSVSSVEPQIYSKRLVDFLNKYLLS